MSIFETYTDLGSVLVGLFTMMLAFFYFKKQDDAPRGGGSVCTACFALILAKLTLPLQTFVSSERIDIPIFLELMMTWVAMSYFVCAGLKLSGKKAPNILPIILVLVGLVINGQMVFGLRDGDMVLKARLIYPAIGFLSLGISLFTRKQYRYASGFNLLSWVAALLGAYYLLQLLPFEAFLAGLSLFPTLCYLLMAIAAMLMVNNLLGQLAQKYEAEATDSKNRLKLIIQSSPFPITISRLKDDHLMMLNNKAGELFGLDASNPGNHRTVDFFADKTNRQELLARLEKNKVVEDFEVLVKKPMGEPFWLLLSARVIDYDYDIAIYCAFQDITGRKQREQELFSKATTDPLTGAYNRRQFEELALKEVQRSKRYGNKFCMLMIDADHFKKVNDTYGHASGDEVLKALSKCCFDTVRESDIVSRFGGEEFVVLLSEVTLENAFLVSERLRVAISKLNVIGEHGEEIKFTVSMGLVESSSKVSDPTTLIKMADEALYKAKEGGRNRVIVYPRTEGEFNPDNFVSASVAVV